MQQVSSCMPSGVLFVRQSDEAEWKKAVSNTVRIHIHTQRNSEGSGGYLWLVCEI